MLMISLKDKSTYITNPYGFVGVKWTLNNYTGMLREFHVGKKLLNSFMVSSITALIVSIISLPSAYSLLTFNRHQRRLVYIIMLIFIFMPTQLILISKYRLFLLMGLVDNYLSVILSGIADWLPTSIILLSIFLKEIDRDLVYAAELDGCNRFQLYIYIILPISLAALSVIFINVFTGMWNSFLEPSLFIRTEEKKLLTSSLVGLNQRFRSNIPFQMAGYVFGMMPTLLVYILFKKQIINSYIAK